MQSISLPQLDGQNVLTHSRMACFKRCPREHYYRYGLGVRRTLSATALRFGSAVHLALELVGKGSSHDQAVQEAAKASADNYEASTIAVLLRGYFGYWAVDGHEPAVTVRTYHAVEQTFHGQIEGTSYTVAGKIDAIVTLADGRLAVMEHKTAGQITEDYWRRLEIDEQISLYVTAARMLGHDVKTVLYDVIRKPSIKPRKGERSEAWHDRLWLDVQERPDWYFQRREIPRLGRDMVEFDGDLRAVAKAVEAGAMYRNTAQCSPPGRRCDYLNVCKRGINRERLPKGFEQVSNVHPELGELS